MKIKELSTCFCTEKVKECQDFYTRYFHAKTTFDCGWYVNLNIGKDEASIQFMQPQGGMPVFSGMGITINIKVDDVDKEYRTLMDTGLQAGMPLEDHPWGDRGFSVSDPIGNSVYIYSDREPSEEFKPYYINE